MLRFPKVLTSLAMAAALLLLLPLQAFASGSIITAGTTRTQAGATLITVDVTRVDTSTAPSAGSLLGDGVLLPQVSSGSWRIWLTNNTANPIQLYGNGTDTVNGVAGSTGIALPPNSVVIVTETSAGSWQVQAGAGYNGAFGTVLAIDGLSANSGGVQAGATAITAPLSRFTTVGGAGYSAVLPASAPGLNFTVVNAGANSMNVFPAGTDLINGQAASAAVPLQPGMTATFSCTLAGKWVVPLSQVMPAVQYTTISQASGVIPAANFAGADKTTIQQSGATALTTPTAAAILAAIPGGAVGSRYRLRIKNTNAGTLTITADASVTLTGTATIATTVWREYDITITGAATATMQDLGSGNP